MADNEAERKEVLDWINGPGRYVAGVIIGIVAIGMMWTLFRDSFAIGLIALGGFVALFFFLKADD